MADLRTMLKRAKAYAEEAQTKVSNFAQVQAKINEFDQDGKDAIADYIKKYPKALTTAMEKTAFEFDAFISDMTKTTITVMDNVQKTKTALSYLSSSSGGGYTDPTSKKLMSDYAESYKISFIVMCVKIVLFFLVLAYIFTMRNLILTLAMFAGVVVVWYSWMFVVNFFEGNNTGGGDTNKGKLCADGTPSDAIGSNCLNVCSTATDIFSSDTYVSCADSPFKCCPDGTQSPDVGLTGCAPTLAACATSLYGYCPDLKSERTDPEGSTCNWTNYKGNCAVTEFGCCPNGTTKLDKLGSNCTLASTCGFSAFGCCMDGTNRDDLAGSNCKENILTE